MALNETLVMYDLLDRANVTGQDVVTLFKENGDPDVHAVTVDGQEGSTDFVRVVIPGTQGRRSGGEAPTLGIIGRLGGVGARPNMIGLVSDGDGAITALTSALKLGRMAQRGDRLPGDVVIATHICPRSPVIPHEPVPFMGSPVDIATMNEYEVSEEMEALLSIDATKGNLIINQRGFAISPTVKEGYILRTSDDLVRIMGRTSGRLPYVFPITTQDITPYGNDVYHINSILQPATATNAPVVGVAITAETAVPGSGTGASHEIDIAETARFCIEVAKEFGGGTCRFYNPEEFDHIVSLYGSMNHLQTLGKTE